MARTKPKKVKLDIKNFDATTDVVILGQKVTVKRVLDIKDQEFIVSNFVRRMFAEDVSQNPFPKHSSWNRLLAESMIRADVIARATNLDLDDLVSTDEKTAFLFHEEEFYNQIISQISNYNNLYTLIDKIVEDVIKQKLSKASVELFVSKLIGSIQTVTTALESESQKIESATQSVAQSVSDSNLSTLLDDAAKQVMEEKGEESKGENAESDSEKEDG